MGGWRRLPRTPASTPTADRRPRTANRPPARKHDRRERRRTRATRVTLAERAKAEKAAMRVHKRRLGKRAAIGADWNGEGENDSEAATWPLAKALLAEGNKELLKAALAYRKTYEQAKSEAQLGGKGVTIGDGIRSISAPTSTATANWRPSRTATSTTRASGRGARRSTSRPRGSCPLRRTSPSRATRTSRANTAETCRSTT